MLTFCRAAPFAASLAITLALAACATGPQPVTTSAAAPPIAAVGAIPATPFLDDPAPLSALVSQVDIPYQRFELANGLTVLVNEDRKAPVVGLSVWYNVGSKDEPKGKTGFAHLFEHLMYYGSDNLRQGIMPFLEEIGATDWNGSTWFDRTNYYETVPRGALEAALFMESDRMGYLLAAVDQKRLDLQRGVVQNEKRQGDNRPGGLVDYEVLAQLFPEGHPYRHDTIGSMADLDSASLADVKRWFLDKYGPNNAIIALSGDISVDEAQTLVTRYFGAIPRGPQNVPAAAAVPTLAAPRAIVMKDRVAAVRVMRKWAVPGLQSPQLSALEAGTLVLGGLHSSRLDRILVRDEKIAVSVEASYQPFHRVGMLDVSATVKPGVDPALVERRLDEIVAQFIAEGPSADEVLRAATVAASSQIRSLEKTGGDGGKAFTLAEGLLYTGDPETYRKELAALAAMTPDDVRAAMSQWLSRPALSVRLEPGERPRYVEATGKRETGADIKVPSVKRTMPPLKPTTALDFPTIERTRLSNGLAVTYARRDAVPISNVVLSFDAGMAADTVDRRGLQNMTMALLDEGTSNRTAQEIAEERERLGASLYAMGGNDRSVVGLSSLSANLGRSLALMTDIVRNPAFAPGDVERIRSQLLTGIAQAKTDPASIAGRALPPLLFGEGHPYATTPLGSEAAVKAISRDELLGFRDRWLRPDNGELFIVSNLPLATLTPMLERAFAGWQAAPLARGVKRFAALPAPPAGPRILFIDRPGSPQSYILGGMVTPARASNDNTALFTGSDALGGSSASRIGDDLREKKGWSYGAYGVPSLSANAVTFLIHAPVQADRTGDSIAALGRHVSDFVGAKGITADELRKAKASGIGALPGQFETGAAVLDAMQRMKLFGRPDDYYERLPARLDALTIAAVDSAMRWALDPKALVWVVVGDGATVRPQLIKHKLSFVEAKPR